MISTLFEGEAARVVGADPRDPQQQSLIYTLTVMSGIAPPHKLCIPGEAIPSLIKLLEEVVAACPELTTDRAKEGVVAMSERETVKAEDRPRIVVPPGTRREDN